MLDLSDGDEHQPSIDGDIELQPLNTNESRRLSESNECKICNEAFNNTRRACVLECTHGPDICEQCISKTETCPFCRRAHNHYIRAATTQIHSHEDDVRTIYNHHRVRRIRELSVVFALLLGCMLLMYIFEMTIERTNVKTLDCTYKYINGSYDLCNLAQAGTGLSSIEQCDAKLLQYEIIRCYIMGKNILTTDKYMAQTSASSPLYEAIHMIGFFSIIVSLLWLIQLGLLIASIITQRYIGFNENF